MGVTLLALGLGAPAAPLGAEPTAPSPEAAARGAAVVEAMTRALGGRKAWDQTRYWRFDWVVERDGQVAAQVGHLWDRETGRYRVEWRTRDGHAVQVLFDVDTRDGRVWVDGAPADSAASREHLERAHGRWINDFYWLAMPWKLQDPGVHVEHVGETSLDGQTYDLLHVWFDQVGMTPGDQYWAWVNRTTHRMDRWAYFLEGTEGEPGLERATPWAWSGWARVGRLWLASDRVQVGGEDKRRIHFPVLDLPRRLDARLFEDPTLPLPAAGR